MFKPNQDRLNYGGQLMPPPGYVLEKAVSTTYSLDLEAITAMAICLGLSEDANTELSRNPMSLLHALHKISDKIIIFCEAGQIKMPKNLHALVLILEKMIVPVALPKDNNSKHYPSFHPKTWLLEYKNEEGKKLYRFAVLSRNLTFDRSWDVMLTLDGDYDIPNQSESQPIADFLEFLEKQLPQNIQNRSNKINILLSFINELKNVGFKPENKFFGFKIYPIGIGNKGYNVYKGDLMNGTFSKCAIMSPFLSGNIIKSFNDFSRCSQVQTRTLITRKTELSKLNTNNAGNFAVYVMKDDVFNGEEVTVENENEEKQKQDIHAKVYVMDNTNKGYSEIYLGSMNATNAATTKNVELITRLIANKNDFNCDMFLEDVLGKQHEEKECPFCQVDISKNEQSETNETVDDLELIIKDLCREHKTAHIEDSRDGKYKVTIHFDLTSEYPNVNIRPLRVNRLVKLADNIVFDDLTLLELSEFYMVNVHQTLENGDVIDISRVITIQTTGIPESRDAAVINSVIKDKKSFLAYIAFILGDDYLVSLFEAMQKLEKETDKESEVTNTTIKPVESAPAVYEKMLKTALNEPERLRDIANILHLIDNPDIVPKEFKDMYALFESVLQEGETYEL